MTREEEIVGLLIEAADAYYNSDETVLSDKEYDDLVDELRAINPTNGFFSVVGFKSRYGQTVSHVYPMRSMQKCNTYDELAKYATKIPESTQWMWEHKIDGGSITLKYNGRKFIQGATRGDGSAGQDVTHTLAYIPNLPKTILYHGEVEIRGEVILPKDTKYDTKGKPLRNSANGLVARKTADMDCANLRFIAYNVICPGMKFTKESDKLDFLTSQGFETTPFGVVTNMADLQKIYLEYHNRIRSQLPYEIDGLIIMPNEVSLQEKYEDGDPKHPAWAIAYKFPNEERETKLLDIEWNVSRLGTVVPVGIFEPVNIGGSTIQRASLNNFQNIEDLDLRQGDTVILQKANDVIPYVHKVLKKGDGARARLVPANCPSCGTTLTTPVVNGKKSVHLVCRNHQGCDEQLISKILFWVQSCEMDGFSDSTIRTLYKNGILRSIKGLYNLKASDMEGLDGFGKSRIDNILHQIHATQQMTLQDFIARLGIPSVGKKALQNLGIKTLQDFKDFKDSTYAVGRSIIDWKAIPENMELVEDLVSNIVLMVARQNDTKVCATGTAPMGRKELIKYLEANGCEWADSVSKDTSLLLTDDVNGSSSKLVKARKLGIPIKTYAEFLNGK